MGEAEVDIDAFVEGCMAMRGAATSLDVQKQLFEHRKLRAQLVRFEHDCKQLFFTIMDDDQVQVYRGSLKAMREQGSMSMPTSNASSSGLTRCLNATASAPTLAACLGDA